MGGLAARIRTLAMPGMLALLGAAAGCAPVADPSAGLSVADAVRILAGELEVGAAILDGRLDLLGDFGVAMLLGAMFGAGAG